MGMIDRYIYAVTKRLPEKQREDIERELRGLIEDMLAERAPAPTERDIEAVLRELGDPAVLADKYRGKGRYLIGPEYFDLYVKVLKIVLVATGLGITVALIAGYAVTPPTRFAAVFGQVIGSIIDALIQAFAWVTAIFALVEYRSAGRGKAPNLKKEFDPKELQEVPVQAARIKRSGPVISIMFSIVLVIILNFSPQLFSVYFNGIPSTPVFDLGVLRGYLFLIDVCFAAVILRDIMRLIYGRYCMPLMAGEFILGGVSLIGTIIFFSDPSVWNQSFIPTMLQGGHVKIPDGFDLANPMISVGQIIIAISVLVFIIEMATSLYKTLRYESVRKSRP